MALVLVLVIGDLFDFSFIAFDVSVAAYFVEGFRSVLWALESPSTILFSSMNSKTLMWFILDRLEPRFCKS